MAEFDPYRKWLGIPEGSRPPTHYQLLGISPDERDQDVVDAACLRQSAFVRNFQTGQHAEHATRILTEIAAAKVCLSDVLRRAAYDLELKRKQPSTAASPDSSASLARPSPRATAPGRSSGDSATFARRSQSTPTPPAPQAAPPRAAPETPPSQGVAYTGYNNTGYNNTAYSAPGYTSPGYGAPGYTAPGYTAPLGPLDTLGPLNQTWPAMTQSVVPGRMPKYMAPRRRGFRLEVWHVAVVGGVAIVLMMIVVGMLVSRGGSSAPVIADGVEPIDPGATQPSSPMPEAPGTRASTATTSGQSTESANAGARNPSTGAATTVGASASDANQSASSGAPTSAPTSAPTASPASSPMPPSRYASLRMPPIEWGGEAGPLTIANENEATPVVSRGGDFLALDNEVWEVSSGKRIGRCGPAGTGSQRAAISPDGRTFANAADSYTDRINVYGVSDGNRIWTLVFKYGKADLAFLEFADNEHLVSIWRGSTENRVQLWKFATGKAVAEMDLDRFEGKCAALSPNGEQIAIAFERNVQVFDLRKRKLLATAVRDGSQSLLGCDGLCFSPDGQEIAAVCLNGGRILAWSGDTEQTYDHAPDGRIRGARSGADYRGPAIAYLPDGSGWLLYGHTLYDRKRQQPAIQILSTPSPTARHVLLAGNRLLVMRGNGLSSELADLNLPWERFERARQARKDSNDGRPSIGLTLTASVPADAQDSLRSRLARRLDAVGYRVGTAETGELRAVYTERTDRRQITEVEPGDISQFGVVRQPRVITRTVQVPVGVMELSLIAPDGKTVLWRDTARAEGDIPAGRSSVSLRTALDNIGPALSWIMVPLLIPTDDELLSLPVVLDISR
jgi:hypothetical protein